MNNKWPVKGCLILKVRELTNKIGDLGTHPRVFIQECGSVLDCGASAAIEEMFGERTVTSFAATNKGEITIFIKPARN